MPFKPGNNANPKGRPKGYQTGRSRALVTLDRLLSTSRNQTELRIKMQEAFDSDAFGFFKTVVMPLLPKENKVDVSRDGIVKWGSLLGDEPGELPRFDAEGKPIPGR